MTEFALVFIVGSALQLCCSSNCHY